jgi:hypothetical protein
MKMIAAAVCVVCVVLGRSGSICDGPGLRIGEDAAPRGSTVSTPGRPHGAGPRAGDRTGGGEAALTSGLENAFSRAMKCLAGRVDISDPQGWLVIQRMETNGWTVTLRKYPELTGGVDSSRYEDQTGRELAVGSVRLKVFDSGNVLVEGVLPRETVSPRDKSIALPEEAFRKAISVHADKVDFFEGKGRIMFTRTKRSEWLVRLTGYSGTYMNGSAVVVDDRLVVNWFPLP